MINSVIYSRVSTSRSRQNIERQELELKSYAENNGIKVLKTFEEFGSGKIETIKRPEFVKMMEFISENNIGLILCSELSRIGRNNIDVLMTINYFNSSKINLYLHDLKFYTRNPDGSLNHFSQLLVGIVSALAENERTQTIERIKSGLENAVEKGHVLCATPLFGYDLVEKKYVINTKNAALIKKIFDMFIGTKKMYNINNFLNDQHPKKNGKNWSTSTLKLMLRNTRYNGWYEYKGKKYDVPKIIDDETFAKAQAILDKNLENFLKLGKRGNQRGKNQRNVHPLVEICKCGHCGGNMWLDYTTGTKRLNQTFYRCKNNKHRPNSTQTKECTRVSANLVNSVILDFALHAFNNSDFNKKREEELRSQINGLKVKVLKSEEIITDNKKQINKLKELYKKEVFTVEEIEEDVNKHRNIIKRNEDDITLVNNQLIDLEKSIKLYTNKEVGNQELLTANNFAEFCKKNIEEVVVTKYPKEGEIWKAWREKVTKGTRGVMTLFKMDIRSNFVNTSLYFTSNSNFYVIEDDRYLEPILLAYDEFYKGDNLKNSAELADHNFSNDEIIEYNIGSDDGESDNFYREFEMYYLMK